MQLINQIVVAVLVTPTEEYEGGAYYHFALTLSNGETYCIGRDYPVGVSAVSSGEILEEKWSESAEFAHLVGKRITGVLGSYGEFEPYVLFEDETVIEVSGEECGTVVNIYSMEEVRHDLAWLLETWKPVTGVN